MNTSKFEVGHYCFCKYNSVWPIGFCSHVDENWEGGNYDFGHFTCFNGKVSEVKEFSDMSGPARRSFSVHSLDVMMHRITQGMIYRHARARVDIIDVIDYATKVTTKLKG